MTLSPHIDIQAELGGGVGAGDQLTGIAAVVASEQNQALRKNNSIFLIKDFRRRLSSGESQLECASLGCCSLVEYGPQPSPFSLSSRQEEEVLGKAPPQTTFPVIVCQTRGSEGMAGRGKVLLVEGMKSSAWL